LGRSALAAGLGGSAATTGASRTAPGNTQIEERFGVVYVHARQFIDYVPGKIKRNGERGLHRATNL